jgi:cytochrome c553
MAPRITPAVVVFGFLALAAAADAGEIPEWAYPVNPPGTAPAADDGRVRHVPDSRVEFTRAQLAAIGVQAPDWHPDEHPAMPPIVVRGRAPQVYACGYCHLPTGAGRPENTSLAGLSANYLRQEMAAFRNGDRPGSEPRRLPQTVMIALAQQATAAEVDEAATYFAALRPVSFVRVVESATVPRTRVAGWTLTFAPDGGTEPIGRRIIEMPEDFERFENRDSRTPYVAYVPPGSLSRGAELAATGGAGRTQVCATCHGPELRGLADVPRLAGRSPSYLARQLHDLRAGARRGGTAELMKPVVASLTDDDIIALAAYAASRAP